METMHEAKGLKDSVVVTGTHYSMSTLMGRIIGASHEFDVVHEPLNHKPTLGYATIPTKTWYEYCGPHSTATLAAGLRRIHLGKGTIVEGLHRVARVRSLRDIGRVGKFTRDGLRRRFASSRAVYKDPFLCFAARLLQQDYGIYVVLTVRHPCGFAESLARRGSGFDFTHLLQPELLDALPALANDIERYAHETQPVLDQAALLWKTVYSFAAAYYLDHPKTLFVRQEDLAAAPEAQVDRVMSMLGCERGPAIDSFLKENLYASAPLDFAHQGGNYVNRNAKETAHKWRRRMEPADITRIIDRVGETLAHYGYQENPIALN